ncbi:sigma factor-like helix-turn-helix DNA-binding protein [Arcanobacterium haemolyticum]|uniref:sigma factor-like helix-turn-helix DNA-binding protein n=1 Tax=Arcanobacterium haemolyticum TaxID=28264 RepID=UPI0021ABD364|nr:sigma factor-like helix-turn-helix DNA-binding protein [Arcanobacterium haemolyticum]
MTIARRRVVDRIRSARPPTSTSKLAFYTGVTHREIAERQQVPLGTVKTRIRDGLARMKRILEEE